MKIALVVLVGALALTGCTERDSQLLAAGAVGAVAGTIIGSELSRPQEPFYVRQPQPRYIVQQRPYFVQQRYVPVPPPRYQRSCFSTWDNIRGRYVERIVCR